MKLSLSDGGFKSCTKSHVGTNDALRHRREILRRHSAVVSVASALSVWCVFAPIAASVVGVVVPLAAFSLDRPAVLPTADVSGPASAGVSADPGSAARSGFPAAFDISGPASGYPC